MDAYEQMIYDRDHLPKFRKEHPYEYYNKQEYKMAKKYALAMIQEDVVSMETFRRRGSIYSTERVVELFRYSVEIPATEMHYDYDSDIKMKIHDKIHYKRITGRAPIGGLLLDYAYVTNPKGPNYPSVLTKVISDIQMDHKGLQGYNDLGGRHWELYGYHFTKEYHPECIHDLWSELPEGMFCDEIGICGFIQERVIKERIRKLDMRKFYYYLKFWDQWGFRMNEFNYYDWTTYYSLQSTKAENYIKDCLRAGKPQPYPYYEKSKDDYWDYVKPNSFEIILDEQLKRGARDRAIYYHQQSEFTEAAPFENSIDLIKALAGDDWRSEETLNRILATFPDLNKQIISPTAPEYKERMELVDQIIKMHPDYAPGYDHYTKDYYIENPTKGVQEWAWRLGALMNAFGPDDPVNTQYITSKLTFLIDKSAIMTVAGKSKYDELAMKNEHKDAIVITQVYNTFKEQLQEEMRHSKTEIKDDALTWYDVQFAAIYSLLHCDNVDALYDSSFAIKHSSIMYSSQEELDRYLKIMELNHKTLYDNGKPLFDKRDQVRLENLKRIQAEFLKYKDGSIINTENEKENELFTNPFLFLNPMTASTKTTMDPHKEQISRKSKVYYETTHNGGATIDVESRTFVPWTDFEEVSFRTNETSYRQIGSFVQTIYSSYDRPFYGTRRHRDIRVHPYLSHSNVYIANPKYYDMTALTRTERNEFTTVVFTNSDNLDDYEGRVFSSATLLTIDFNDYTDMNIVSPVEDPATVRNMVPNANLDEIFELIPELKAKNIPFAISDNGLLTLYSNFDYRKQGKTAGVTNVVEFLESHPELLINHYFDAPFSYGLEMSFNSKKQEYPGVYNVAPVKKIDHGSYLALRKLGMTYRDKDPKWQKADPSLGGVDSLDPAFVELFRNYSYSNRPTLEQVLPVAKQALARLDRVKKQNVIIEPDPEPVILKVKENDLNQNDTSFLVDNYIASGARSKPKSKSNPVVYITKDIETSIVDEDR